MDQNRTPKFKYRVKLHKPGEKIRPIIDSAGGPNCRVEEIIKEYQKGHTDTSICYGGHARYS